MMTSSNQRRELLSKVVGSMCAVVILMFVFVLFRSLSGGVIHETTTTNSSRETLINELSVGETTIKRFQKQRVWITRISPSQREYAAQLAEFVNSSDQDLACQQTVTACFIAAATLHSGIEITYSRTAPPQLPRGTPWFGGFVDPTSGAVYDLLGRAYSYQKIDSLKAL